MEKYRHCPLVTGLMLLAMALFAASAVAWAGLDEPDYEPAPYREFLEARAAAEVCRGTVLTQAEHHRFLVSLSYRYDSHPSPEQLDRKVQKELQQLREQFKKRGCDDEHVQEALFDWDFRVTLFAVIRDPDAENGRHVATSHRATLQDGT